MSRADQFIKYNYILGKQPSMGPVPANQIVPWLGLIVISYVITNGFLSLGLTWFFAIAFWLIASWWLLTGSKPYKFMNQWRNAPGTNWFNGNKRYIPLLPGNRARRVREKYGDVVVRVQLKPRKIPNETGGQHVFMPFQNEVNLCCIAEIKKDNRVISAYLLELGNNQFQFVFGWKLQGLHDVLTKEEVTSSAEGLEEGFKYLLAGERLTFHVSCKSKSNDRLLELEHLANQCDQLPISVILRNEQKRVQELTEEGKRQQWEQWVFATWTASSDGESVNKDWWSGLRNLAGNIVRSTLGTITGSTRTYQEQFYTKLLLRAFNEGFIQWEMLLDTKTGLNLTPCTKEEMWGWLWNRFNDGAAPAIPQIVQLQETDKGMVLRELVETEKHCVTVLIEGTQGRSSCPSHGRRTDTITLPGKAHKPHVTVLTMEEAPAGWTSLREQLRWVWKAMSSSFVHDTEAWVELTTASDLLVRDNLSRQAKSSKSASERALTKGQGRDIGAEVKREESFEAQRQLYQGIRAVHAAPVFLVYRENPRQLELACQMLANNFDSAKMIRESHIAWEIWLQSLPITHKRLLHDTNIVSSERRLTPTTQTVLGFLPLTVPRDLDKKGVEFLTERGGKPIHIDIFSETKRAAIFGTSGSGKSVLATRFMFEALARNIPVVGMDLTSGKDSTFKTAIGLLGDQGAYLDMKQSRSNLLEPPDLRKFDREERLRRMESWKEMVLWPLNVIAMGGLNNPNLAQRIEALLKQILKIYLQDPEIINRYNLAFEAGWKSAEWQAMPTLKDFRRYCTRERLNKVDMEDIDKQALNQIVTQFDALFTSEVGKVLSSPSSFSPDPAVKFFALSGMKGEGGQDAYLMAINAHSACIRTALSHPRSLFVGDELSVLLQRKGFAHLVGELCATGRKDGISVVLIAQDPDSIATCDTGSMILQNINYRLTGRITSAAVNSFERFLGYPAGIIARNASDVAKPRLTDLSSYWLIEQDNRFWTGRFLTCELLLSSVANSQDEQNSRNRVFAQFPNTEIGRLEALVEFNRQYIPALKDGRGLDQVGLTIHQPLESAPDTPPAELAIPAKQLILN